MRKLEANNRSLSRHPADALPTSQPLGYNSRHRRQDAECSFCASGKSDHRMFDVSLFPGFAVNVSDDHRSPNVRLASD